MKKLIGWAIVILLAIAFCYGLTITGAWTIFLSIVGAIIFVGLLFYGISLIQETEN